MKITFVLFALARDLAGKGEVQLEVPEGATVAQARQALAVAVPALEKILGRCMIALDEDYADDNTVLSADATLACIPPVSGG